MAFTRAVDNEVRKRKGLAVGKHLPCTGNGNSSGGFIVSGDIPTSTHWSTICAQLLEQLRFLKPSVPVFRKPGAMRHLLIEAQTGEPAPRQMHVQLLHQLALAADAVQIADEENAQQELGSIEGRPLSL
jgi:hypothetical protein